jgi:hypothetical protein
VHPLISGGSRGLFVLCSPQCLSPIRTLSLLQVFTYFYVMVRYHLRLSAANPMRTLKPRRLIPTHTDSRRNARELDLDVRLFWCAFKLEPVFIGVAEEVFELVC